MTWKKSAAQKSLSTNRIALLSSEVERNVAVPGSAVLLRMVTPSPCRNEIAALSTELGNWRPRASRLKLAKSSNSMACEKYSQRPSVRRKLRRKKQYLSVRSQLFQGCFVAQNECGSVQFDPALAFEFAERPADRLSGRADQLCHLIVR